MIEQASGSVIQSTTLEHSNEITADLDALLVRAQVAPPYILIGHSMGGLMVRNFFRHHPEKVAGVVLLDAAEEEHNFARIRELREAHSNTKTNVWLARFGIIRLLLTLAPEKAGVPNNVGPELKEEIVKEHSRSEFFQSVAYELEAYFSAPQEMRKSGGFGSLGSTPLVVVTHGKSLNESQPFYNGWSEAQSRLAALSTDSKTVVAEHSGHDIGLDQPDLVAQLVHDLVRKTATRK